MCVRNGACACVGVYGCVLVCEKWCWWVCGCVRVCAWVCLFVSLCASVQIGNRVKLPRRGIILIKVQPQVELHFH